VELLLHYLCVKAHCMENIFGNYKSPLDRGERDQVSRCCGKESIIINVQGDAFFFNSKETLNLLPCCPDTPTPPSCPQFTLEVDGEQGNPLSVNFAGYSQGSGGKATVRVVNMGPTDYTIPASTTPPTVSATGFSPGSFSFSPNTPFGPITIPAGESLDIELELTPGEATGTDFTITVEFEVPVPDGCTPIVLNATITGEVQGTMSMKVYDAANGSVTEIPNGGSITDTAKVGDDLNSLIRYDNLGTGAAVMTNLNFTFPAPPSLVFPSPASLPYPTIGVTTLNPGGSIVVYYDVDVACPPGVYPFVVSIEWTDSSTTFTHTTNGSITVIP
jgi:hypothetical protein